MDKKLKEKWVKALKSGRYKQTRETLKESDRFCCLGVLLSVSRKGRWDGDVYVVGSGDDETSCEGDLCHMREVFGITKAQEAELVRLNDKKQEDFDAIAAHIKKAL